MNALLHILISVLRKERPSDEKLQSQQDIFTKLDGMGLANMWWLLLSEYRNPARPGVGMVRRSQASAVKVRAVNGPVTTQGIKRRRYPDKAVSLKNIEWTVEDWKDFYKTLRAFKKRVLKRHKEAKNE